MRKTINTTRVEGKVYEHDLQLKVTGETSKNPGTQYIGGTIDIATDNDGLNVVTVHFTYVTAVTKTGKVNDTFTTLKNIIDSGKTVLVDGYDNATAIRIDSAIGVNDFYTKRNGEEVLVSAKRNEGGFAHITNQLGEEKSRNTFTCDMLINKTTLVEADPEKKIENDYLVIKGGVFNFRNDLIPVEFIVKDASGIKYFESLDITPANPVFTKVWGRQYSQTIVDRREEESAFGSASVKEYSRTIREWVVEGTSTNTYEIGDEQNGITADEIKKIVADREVHLADVKKRQEEYQASKNTAVTANPGNPGVTAAMGGFNF